MGKRDTEVQPLDTKNGHTESQFTCRLDAEMMVCEVLWKGDGTNTWLYNYRSARVPRQWRKIANGAGMHAPIQYAATCVCL